MPKFSKAYWIEVLKDEQGQLLMLNFVLSSFNPFFRMTLPPFAFLLFVPKFLFCA
jgi:hypothetical protein